MIFLKFFLRPQSLALAVLAIVLAACTVVVDEGPGPRPPYPGPGPQFCTREYEPVCARRGGDRQTFANACMARRSGYRVIGDGQCRGGGWNDGGDGDRPQFCTREYAPVCARRRGQLQTFPNNCEARAAGWRVVDGGPC
ncbi:Kazal-type serine protease inhibitor domain-containing protein [Mesorhizobium sp. NPDC059054]|uniref:Kazal-type serine protease inhibitor domain-containing protein n=1 Tax=Mesorhizobium sp. NPDC059054 TaxID=3346711 RepID=UPI0036B9A5B9